MPFGKGRPSGRTWELKKNSLLILVLCLLMASFAGCGYAPSESNKNSNNVGSLDPRDLATPPKEGDGITVDAPVTNLQGDPNAPQDAIAQAGQFEARPGGMIGSLGVNLNTYFAEDIQDPITRIKRLERALAAIQGDLKTVAPPIQRLVAVESDIQELVTQLEILLETDSQPSSQPLPAVPPASVPKPEALASTQSPPVPLAPVPAAEAMEEAVEQPSPEKQATPPPEPGPSPPPATPPPKLADAVKPEPVSQPPPTPPPSPPEGAKPVTTTDVITPSVVDLRVGEHTDKVRLVLDLNAGAAFTADLDNAENILVIELPGAGWAAATSQTFGDSPLLKNYTVETEGSGKGSMLILQLKKASAIITQQMLDGEGGKGRRIVIDLKK